MRFNGWNKSFQWIDNRLSITGGGMAESGRRERRDGESCGRRGLTSDQRPEITISSNKDFFHFRRVLQFFKATPDFHFLIKPHPEAEVRNSITKIPACENFRRHPLGQAEIDTLRVPSHECACRMSLNQPRCGTSVSVDSKRQRSFHTYQCTI